MIAISDPQREERQALLALRDRERDYQREPRPRSTGTCSAGR